MSVDLTGLLRDWDYEPGKLNVRMVTGDDGEPKIQLRLDLGILQMEASGRPDGQRPGGYESLLEMQEARLDDHVAEHGSAAGFILTEEDCRDLRDEATQYYHRYVCLLALEEFQGVVRDTTRNLRTLDMCGRFAEIEADRVALEQFRPYIMMMRARALASEAIRENEPKAAVLAIDQGLEALRRYFSEHDQPDLFDRSAEVQALRGMREALTPKLPISQQAELRERLRQALTRENYELAAILRDELRLLD